MTKFIDAERLIHSLKTAIACIIGLILTKLIQFPSDLWIVVSILVVMCAQMYVGSALYKAYLRFLGTTLGCLFAVTAILIGENSYVAIVSTIAISSFIFSYLATGQENL